MKNYRTLFVLINLVCVLTYFGYNVMQKETLSKEGRLVLLELAPVDPRSLMQGDYMDLRYKIAEDASSFTPNKNGYCVVQLGRDHVAHFVRLQPDKTPLEADEYLIQYKADNWRINIGAESFFFQEGHGERYEKAKYGGLRIDDRGHSLLIGLYDVDRKEIK